MSNDNSKVWNTRSEKTARHTAAVTSQTWDSASPVTFTAYSSGSIESFTQATRDRILVAKTR